MVVSEAMRSTGWYHRPSFLQAFPWVASPAMPSKNVVDLAGHRRRLEAKSRPAKEPIPERIACVLLGSIIALIGFAPSLTFLAWGFAEPVKLFSQLPYIAGLSFIGLFGLNGVIQGLRGRSRHEGIFYGLLGAVKRWGPWPWALGIPLVAVAALGVAGLADDPAASVPPLHLLGAWMFFMLHVAVHELGHYVAARLVSLHPSQALVGPVELARSTGGWKVGFSREWWSLVGGWVALDVDEEALPPRKRLFFAAGGPVATVALLAAIVAASPVPVLDLFYASAKPTHTLYGYGVMMGVAMLLLNLTPVARFADSPPTDGDQILCALRQMRT